MPQQIDVPGYGLVEFPDDMTDEQISGAIKKNMMGNQGNSNLNLNLNPPKKNSIGRSLFQGLRDPLDAGAQLLSHAVPEGVRSAVDTANNWLADNTGLVGRVPEGGVDALIKQQEAEYQAGRGDNPGVDLGRMAGNIATTLPLSFVPGLQIQSGKKAFDLANLGRAAIQGGAVGALQPVTEGEFGDEKLSQLGAGALFGGLSQPVAAAVGNVISPRVRPEIQALQKEGIPLTPGQIVGGRVQALEDKAMSVPLVGDLISNARERGKQGLNQAAYARALKGTGIDPASLPVGSEGIDAVRSAVGQQYDNLLPKMAFQADNVFNQELGNLQAMAKNLAPTEAARFNSIINEHLTKLSPNGGMTGETYKILESALRNDAKKFTGSTDAYQRELGDALLEAGRIFKSGLERSNPQFARELADANRNYANYSIIRRAGSSAGAPENGFTPAQLAAAVKAGDKSVGKGSTATGRALLQDLASAGRTLESKVPNSGTTDRLLMAGAGGALGVMNPQLALLMAAGAIPYTKTGGKVAEALLTKRPANAQQLKNALRLTAPVAGAVIAEQ